MKTKRTLPALLMFAAGILLVAAPIVQANGIQTAMHYGRMWGNPENDMDAARQIIWPAGFPRPGKYGDVFTGDYHRSWINPHEKGGTYLFTTDWTDPLGVAHEFASSSFFRVNHQVVPTEYLTEGNNFNYL